MAKVRGMGIALKKDYQSVHRVTMDTDCRGLIAKRTSANAPMELLWHPEVNIAERMVEILAKGA
jgi:hypothetical protein